MKNYVKLVKKSDSTEGTPYSPNLRTRVKKHLGKIVAGGMTAIYEGVLVKYLHDLNNVLSHPSVQARVWRGKLPIYPVEAELFPWPKLIEYPVTDVTGCFARPMSQIDYAVKFFYDNPILQVVAIATPFILWAIYYGIKKYGIRNGKKHLTIKAPVPRKQIPHALIMEDKNMDKPNSAKREDKDAVTDTGCRIMILIIHT